MRRRPTQGMEERACSPTELRELTGSVAGWGRKTAWGVPTKGSCKSYERKRATALPSVIGNSADFVK